MNRLCGLLALFLGSLLCASSVFARGSLATWPHANNPIPAARAAACTLDVVLVTFLNETTVTAGEDCLYCNHDRPYGTNPGESADSSYTRRDFERLFSGGYDGLPAFVGTNQTVGKGHKLPEVFGSVRAYYD